MKIQRGIVDYEGETVQCICEVSNPEDPQVILSLHRAWNNNLVAEKIFNIFNKHFDKE